MRTQEVTSPKPHLYLDMDGVQADFFTAWAQLSGKQRYKEIGDRAAREASISDLNNRGPEFVEQFFTNLPVLPGAHELINFLQTNKIPYTVLSAPLRGNEEASIRGKIAWLHRHHPGTAGTAIFTSDKQHYATHNGHPNVLVDDFKRYINAWTKSGGLGVLYRWNNVVAVLDQLKEIYGIGEPTTEGTVVRGTDRIDVFLKGKHHGETITRPVARNFPNSKLDYLIRYLVDRYNVNPNAIVYGPSRSSETFESRVGYMYPPDIVGVLHIGDFTIPVHRHSLARAAGRRVDANAVDRALRKLPQVSDALHSQQAGSKLWVYDPDTNISLGLLTLDSGRLQLNTVLPHKPHEQGLTDIVVLPNTATENFADGRKPGRRGLAKRVGVNCKQPVSKLRSIASNSSGEKQRMAHWCANMKSGRKRSNESEMPYQAAVNAGAMSTQDMARNVVQDLQDKIEQLSNQAHALRDEIKRTRAAQASIPADAQHIKIKPNANWTARDSQGRGMAGGAVGSTKK